VTGISVKIGLNEIYEAMHGFEQTQWFAAHNLGSRMYAGGYKSLLINILFFTNSSDVFSPAARGGTPIGAATVRCRRI
jgi:hypothetical protein